jgi:hypothetical protein
MANLLPPAFARTVLRDTSVRFAAVAAAAIAGLGMFFIVALTPTYVLVAGDTPATSTSATTKAEDEAVLARAQALVEQLAPHAAAGTTLPAILTALSLRPAGVHIISISYAAGKNGTDTATLAGSADRREDLEAYRSALQTSGAFASVSIPVAALVGTTQGEFTVTLTGNF